MKKLFGYLLLFLTAFQLNAQTKDEAAAQKALVKAKSVAANPKKARKASTWLRLGEAYVNCYDAPISGVWSGAPKLQVKLFFKDQQILSTSEVEKGGTVFSVDHYSDKDLYYDKSGKLQAWIVTKPVNDEDNLGEAVKAYDKAAELDNHGSSEKDIKAAIKGIQNRYFNIALSYHQLGDDANASDYFVKAYQTSSNPVLNENDTTSMYYAAYTAQMSGNNERALEYFQKCYENGVFQNGDIFSLLANSYMAKGDTTKSKELLSTGVSKYPQNQNILISLINLYIQTKDDPDKILNILHVAEKNEPKNASLYYAEGGVYLKIDRFDDAIATFRKSSQVDKNYFWGPFSVGQAYYNKAVKLQTEAAKEMDDAKFQAMNKQMDSCLRASIEPFERAYSIAPNTQLKAGVAEYLKNIYFRFRSESQENMDNYKKYKEIADSGVQPAQQQSSSEEKK